MIAYFKSTASECVLVAMLSARRKAITRAKKIRCDEEDGTILNRLVVYCSKMVNYYYNIEFFNY